MFQLGWGVVDFKPVDLVSQTFKNIFIITVVNVQIHTPCTIFTMIT